MDCEIRVQIALMEFHEVGPVKIFDTAGVDELGVLGSKKASAPRSIYSYLTCALLEFRFF